MNVRCNRMGGAGIDCVCGYSSAINANGIVRLQRNLLLLLLISTSLPLTASAANDGNGRVVAFVSSITSCFTATTSRYQRTQHCCRSSASKVRLFATNNNNVDDELVVPVSTFQKFVKESTATEQQRPNKRDLYTNKELADLFQMHTVLTENGEMTTTETSASSNTGSVTVSLQDIVERTILDIERGGSADNELQNSSSENAENGNDPETTSLVEATSTNSMTSSAVRFHSRYDIEELRKRIPNIRAVASDVDGTLLSSSSNAEAGGLHPVTRRAIEKAVEATFSPLHPLQHFFIATGKTREGALSSLGPTIRPLLEQLPGVFCQGLYCVDGNKNVIFEAKLSDIAVGQAEELARRHNVTLLAYQADKLYAAQHSSVHHVHEAHEKWGEPLPTLLSPGILLVDAENNQKGSDSASVGYHKVLFMDDDVERLRTYIRPKLEALATTLQCEVTSAVPTMLELLPAGCSKQLGVQKLCDYLGITDTTTQLVGIGDAENDLGFLQSAAIGIAVGNAADIVKDVADVVMDDTSSNGAAGHAIELFGLGEVLQHDEEIKK